MCAQLRLHTHLLSLGCNRSGCENVNGVTQQRSRRTEGRVCVCKVLSWSKLIAKSGKSSHAKRWTKLQESNLGLKDCTHWPRCELQFESLGNTSLRWLCSLCWLPRSKFLFYLCQTGMVWDQTLNAHCWLLKGQDCTHSLAPQLSSCLSVHHPDGGIHLIRLQLCGAGSAMASLPPCLCHHHTSHHLSWAPPGGQSHSFPGGPCLSIDCWGNGDYKRKWEASFLDKYSPVRQLATWVISR